jgi:heptaprenyl diphosphate synthase
LSIMVIVMVLFGLGIPSTSVLASITHNFVQIIVAYLIMETKIIFSYLPYLSIISILSGIITGLISFWILKSVSSKNYLM